MRMPLVWPHPEECREVEDFIRAYWDDQAELRRIDLIRIIQGDSDPYSRALEAVEGEG